jgi:uncharacterized membrane protein YoaK (UPF0700 family)
VARLALGPIGAGALLAFTAGFVDTTGFIALFGLFTAHVTGNFVLIGAGLAEPHQALIGKLLALPVFVVVVAATRLFVLAREARGRNAVPGLVIGQALFLVLFLLAGIAASPIGYGDEPLAILAGMLGVTAMAIQNAGSRTVFATLAPTTVMTGNVTQVVIDLVDLAAQKAARDQARGRLVKMLPAVVAFAVGAIAGALGYKLFGFWCLLAPIVTVSALMVQLLPRPQSADPA